MTPAEALLVASVVVQADGGCPHCVGNLLVGLSKSFPSIPWGDIASEAGPQKWVVVQEGGTWYADMRSREEAAP